jgi:hypothetical protein
MMLWYVVFEYLMKRKGKEKVGYFFHQIQISPQKKMPTNLAMPIRDIMNVFILGNDFFLCLYSAGHNSRK